MENASFINRYWKSLVWALIILFLCGMPSDDVPSLGFLNIPHLDKFIHLVLYFVFALLLYSGVTHKAYKKSLAKKNHITIAVIAIGYGICIEIMQYHLFTSRSAELGDAIANIAGYALGTIMYRWINRITDGII
ncbi:MAG: VanZ family protein [Bacteroidales bacterium]|nr:VanZ family protein [Bacteroidales bacterium]MBN2748276.1 VanZ family protein [Bacteroidales bacterium]